MSCYNPLAAVPDGKGHYRIMSLKEAMGPPALPYKEIPCGRCIGCRLDYSREWANRCLCELQYHDSAYFVTLTYDDSHIPLNFYPDPETGEAHPSRTTSTRDIQLFFKRLRKAFPDDKIRYFGCSEYGPQTYRPHYHFIIFGLHLDDLVPERKNGRGEQLFVSERFNRCWSFPRRDANGDFLDESPSLAGFTLIGSVTWETCAYVARYVTKKLYGQDAEFYKTFNLEPPKIFCSRNPGIGREYYESHKEDLFDDEYINIATEKGGRKFRPPRYFRRCLEQDDPEKAEAMRLQRMKMAIISKQTKLDATDLSYLDYLAVAEESQEKRTRVLQRSDL